MSALLYCVLGFVASAIFAGAVIAWIVGGVLGLRLIGLAVVDRVREVLRG